MVRLHPAELQESGWSGRHHTLSARRSVTLPQQSVHDRTSRRVAMLVNAALLLLAAWLLGVLGLYELGSAVHVLFLVGLMLLMLGVLKGRDANRLDHWQPRAVGRAGSARAHPTGATTWSVEISP